MIAHEVRVVKISGAGNTFCMLSFADENYLNHLGNNSKLTRAQMVQKLCHRTEGFNTDGTLFLFPSEEENTWRWDFFNSDGSSAEFCGNAARCAAAFCKEFLKPDANKFFFQTHSGLVVVERGQKNSDWTVHMPKVQIVESKKVVMVSGFKIEGFFVNTGVPHFVLEVKADEAFLSKKKICRQLRPHSIFSRAGTNVTLVKQTEDLSLINAITFERGVEDFTLACGTGAVAAAVRQWDLYKKTLIQVQMPGGCLTVDIKDLNSITMSGPTEVILDKKIKAEDFFHETY